MDGEKKCTSKVAAVKAQVNMHCAKYGYIHMRRNLINLLDKLHHDVQTMMFCLCSSIEQKPQKFFFMAGNEFIYGTCKIATRMNCKLYFGRETELNKGIRLTMLNNLKIIICGNTIC